MGAGGAFALGAGTMNVILGYSAAFTGWQAAFIAGATVFLGG